MENSSKVNIAVDLTPLRPGGENGGAKTLIITLLNSFAKLRAQEFHYLLITETWNHRELLELQGSNITCVLSSEIYNKNGQSHKETLNDPGQQAKLLEKYSEPKFIFAKKSAKRLIKNIAKFAISLAKPLLGDQTDLLIKSKAVIKRKKIYGFLEPKALASSPLDIQPHQIRSSSVLQTRYDIKLLFCPFSSPHLAEEGLPLVAIAYDLQHLELPFFFATEERLHRTQFLNDLVDRANKIICISKFTQQSLLKYFPVRENQLTAVPICIHERFTSICHEDMVNVLRSLGLSEGNYIFFPANFWPHKNHRMLLAAYSIYRLSYPNNALDLVFTGALEEPQVELREMTSNLGCEANVHFLGFLDEKELIALWQGCKGLVFPSLYEGFGIPVLEAMWFDKPVACSAIGSLPEVGDDAVVYFDPRKPESIAEAIGKIAHNEDLTMDLLERSRQYIKGFSQEAMAEQYLAVFSDALSKSKLPVPENVV